jgi:predicted membrane channel-forming protein YqfA (hemolysin III family)
MLSANQVEKRRQVAGVFIVLGLVIEALCLIWPTPIAFVIFVAIGGLLMFVGIVLYLYSLVSNLEAPE